MLIQHRFVDPLDAASLGRPDQMQWVLIDRSLSSLCQCLVHWSPWVFLYVFPSLDCRESPLVSVFFLHQKEYWIPLKGKGCLVDHPRRNRLFSTFCWLLLLDQHVCISYWEICSHPCSINLFCQPVLSTCFVNLLFQPVVPTCFFNLLVCPVVSKPVVSTGC